MDIKFLKRNDQVILECGSESGTRWVWEKLNQHGECKIKNVYHLSRNQIIADHNHDDSLIDMEWSVINFSVANLEGDYFKFKRELFSIKVDVFIHKEINIKHNMFYAPKNISVFKKINQIVNEDIYISNETNELKSGRIPISDFKRLIKQFPTTYRLNKYAEARVGSILGDYFESYSEAEEKYKNLLKRADYRKKRTLPELQKSEKNKYKFILEKLKKMLADKEEYNEKEWQEELLDILLLIYPKYIEIFDEVFIKTEEGKSISLDYMLLDSRGHIDIVEIKKPSETKRVMREATYRGNHMPSRELIGSIMQVEKYIFHLNKSGKRGEDQLNKKYQGQLQNNLKINVVNPKGLILMGQESDLSEDQRKDFEITRRKYKNIIDIITYDELIRSLERLINKFSRHSK